MLMELSMGIIVPIFQEMMSIVNGFFPARDFIQKFIILNKIFLAIKNM